MCLSMIHDAQLISVYWYIATFDPVPSIISIQMYLPIYNVFIILLIVLASYKCSSLYAPILPMTVCMYQRFAAEYNCYRLSLFDTLAMPFYIPNVFFYWIPHHNLSNEWYSEEIIVNCSVACLYTIPSQQYSILLEMVQFSHYPAVDCYM